MSPDRPEPGLAAKVAFLREPSAYPERPRAVEAKETHMSWVFLTDSDAYKLKKPRRTAFLDFSTLAARRLNCRREVRLNRRLAPEVYLGTVALCADAAGRLQLGGGGRVVDWLVKSRRLPAERTLEHAIEAGTLRQADVQRLIDRLIPFFRDARPVRLGPAAYCRRFVGEIEANRRELSRPAFGLELDVVDELAAGQRRFLAAHGALLEARARAGRIVDGHGDLRPEHIYLNAVPVVMDCIEFNRDLRMLDPVDELAYLAVECDRLGAPFVEDWIFDAYRRSSGDDPPRALVEFYKCFRAVLRAKIAIWHLDEPLTDSAAKWRARTRQYLRLAQGYAQPPAFASPRDRAVR
jgi:uncharacterized protein